MTILYTQDDRFTGHYSLRMNGRICGIPYYLIDKFMLDDEFISKCLVSWKLRKVGWRPELLAGIYVKGLLPSWIVQFILFSKHQIYYNLLDFLWKLKLVSDTNGEYFSWKKHFRPLKYLTEGGAEIR